MGVGTWFCVGLEGVGSWEKDGLGVGTEEKESLGVGVLKLVDLGVGTRPKANGRMASS